MKIPLIGRAKFKKNGFVRGLCLLFAGALACWLMLPMLAQIARQGSMLAAALTLPQGSLELLKERFTPEIDEPVPAPLPPVIPEPTPAPPSSSESSESAPPQTPPTVPNEPPPDIPAKYRGDLLSELMIGKEGNASWLNLGTQTAYLRNYTKHSPSKIKGFIENTKDIKLGPATQPTVLIVHTHATESYEQYDSPFYDMRNTWRSTDNTKNMVAVGQALATALEAQGIGVIHDTTQHDYPSYNGSYENSKKTIQKWLKEYPSIKIVLDVHRDAIQRDERTIVKPVTTIDGKKAAQMMIIAGCDDGTMNMPNWKSNLRFATNLTKQIEDDYPTLTRPIFFCYRKYNMDLTVGSLLLEFGSNANTLEEAVYSGELVGKSLAKLIANMQGS